MGVRRKGKEVGASRSSKLWKGKQRGANGGWGLPSEVLVQSHLSAISVPGDELFSW